jgi:hypothetical protein
MVANISNEPTAPSSELVAIYKTAQCHKPEQNNLNKIIG